jgi:GNAT superfamily N-acetyltransferase
MERGVAWVAVDGSDDPIGFINGEPLDDYLHIWEMSVNQDQQGNGIGRALMNRAKDHAKRSGYRGLTLTTFRNVPWNDSFYMSAGFTVLQPTEVSSALMKVLQEEVQAGLPGERRCAMRLEFG